MKYLLPPLSVVLLVVVCPGAAGQVATAPRFKARLLPTSEYEVDLISSTDRGFAMNNSREIAGAMYVDNGCGSNCIPPFEAVVWRNGVPVILPGLAGETERTVTAINDAGWVAGYVGSYWFPRAVVWQPVGNTYQVIDLGFLPGTNKSRAVGIDDQGRVVGWSTDGNAIFPVAAPFSWSVSTGMVDLALLGYPDEEPRAMSPGGTVALVTSWYRLGDPSSVTSIPGPPSGHRLSADPIAINDAGDEARFLITSSGQHLVHLYRYHHDGSWQLLSPFGSTVGYGIGAINDALDVTATVGGTGVIAYGPDGTARSLGSLLSPPFQGLVTGGGPLNQKREILATLMLGYSPRLVRLSPAHDCWSGCLQVKDLTIQAVFVPDPSDPTQDHCAPDLNAHNEALVSLKVVTPSGAPQAGVHVTGRFLDEYWANAAVSGITDANGDVSFSYSGDCGVGAITFFVDSATHGQAILDKTKGVLSVWAIPQ